MGVLASSHKPAVPGGSDSWQAAVLVYNSDDNSTSTNSDDVTISLRGLAAQKGQFHPLLSGFMSFKIKLLFYFILFCYCSVSYPCPGLVYVTYYLDNNVTNPYQLWQSMGSPDYPTAEQFRRLRGVQVNRKPPPSKPSISEIL